MGKEILQRVEKEPTVPMFVTYSESDRAINHHEIESLFEALLKQQPKYANARKSPSDWKSGAIRTKSAYADFMKSVISLNFHAR
jgi:hypothetical protein